MPPEIISGEIYTGAGSGPLHAAAAALNSLAAELGITAAGWESTMATLTAASGWQGTGAAAAAAAAQTYISWLLTTQAAVEQAAAQASASALAFDVVHMAVATPVAIATNRANYAAALAGLPVTAPLVATLEAEYEAMWAQDVAAMGVYQAASAAAGVLPPLVSVTGTVNPAADAAAVAAAPAAPAASALTSGLSSLSSSNLVSSVDGFLGTPAVFNGINGAVNTGAWFTMNAIPTTVSLGHTLGTVQSIPFALSDAVAPAPGGGAITPGTMVGSVTGASASASVGEASAVGRLSVPASWSTVAKAGTLASSAAPLEGSGWTVPGEEPVAAMPGMPGMAAAAKGAGAYGAGPRYGFKPIVMPKQVVV
ncbi:PPE family protein [Mycobacterium sp. 663a-19]|uniref:PPE family protein n=1 Tax=Mycobacterium sp. 663a-19 TaxID=2986148 RepID=UPI002D1E727C|nr:PPE family protein [Mycobacterium sp. 663a-19]MEB3980375.1 PPE family protein [Mycobacterium sp. 663a-19]